MEAGSPHPPVAEPLERAARWLFTAIIILGMTAWWLPGFRTWACLIAGWFLLLVLWIVHSLATRERSIPGHPFHLALLALMAVMFVHFAKTRVVPGAVNPVADAMSTSLFLQLGLMALGIAISQSLLPRVTDNTAALGACAVAMVVGSICSLLWTADHKPPTRCAWTLAGYAGVCLWLTPAILSMKGALSVERVLLQRPAVRAGWLVLTLSAVAGLVALAPASSAIALTIIGVSVTLGSLACRFRSLLTLAGAALAAMGVAGIWLCDVRLDLLPGPATDWLGAGGMALATMGGEAHGVTVLGGAAGYAGLGAVGVCAAACLLLFVRAARRLGRPRQIRAILWIAMTALAIAAWLAPGGVFSPSIMLLLTVAMGMAPTITSVPARPHSAWWLVAILGAMTVQFAAADHRGLGQWSLEAFGLPDGGNLLLGMLGFVAGLALAWIVGTDSWKRGTAGVALLVCAPPAVSLAVAGWNWQALSGMAWLPMSVGASLALPLYALVMAARWEPPPPERELPEPLRQQDFPSPSPMPPRQRRVVAPREDQ